MNVSLEPPKTVSTSTMHPQAQTDFAGLVAFFICAVSASLSTAAILIWRHIASMELDLEGGGAFAMYSTPNFLSLAGMAAGLAGLLSTTIAIAASERRKPFLFSLLHVISAIFLAPGGYLLFRTLLH